MQHTHAQLKRYNHLLGELEAVYHDLSYQLGMSDSVSKILYTLCCEGGPCRISDICLCSGLSKQTVNSALRKLEAPGPHLSGIRRPKGKNRVPDGNGNRFCPENRHADSEHGKRNSRLLGAGRKLPSTWI